ncbi:hypothetical protein A5806_002498 [Enterococcus faecium]|uniref:helix-turn-helix domain-containing protein n=1 Tax=Enterococcus faecium TaxID=1352 RepID=UPI000B3E785F|nr:helix-turn-helix domain-containing protein [Enterococcus faecium]OUZ27890.1 hypothetical protein A5806_002498 [Enterococcus faecium]
MNKEIIFDTHYKNEYILLKLLYISSRELSKQEICRELGITLPTLSKIVSNIKDDFYNQLQSSEIKFIVKRNTIKLEYERNISLDELTTHLLQKSYKYRLLKIIFLCKNKRYKNLENIFNVSSSTLNRIINSCNEILSEYDLKIIRGKIVGSATQYFYFYYMLFLISPRNQIITNPIIINIIDSIKKLVNLSPSKKKQLSLWIFLLIKKLNSIDRIRQMCIRDRI